MSVVNYTPRTWVVGEIVTATFMNTEIRDFSNNLQSAWTSYTPALTGATTNPALGTGGATGGYQQYGKTIFGNGRFAFGASGSSPGSGLYSISLPVAILAADVSGGGVVGDGVLFDSSAAAASQWYTFELVANTSTTCRAVITGQGIMSSATPVAPAASDAIRFKFFYQAA